MITAQLSITELEMIGQNGEQLANRFFRQKNPTTDLAVVLPGLRYNCDKPLLYYTSQAHAARGMDVLQVWVDYTRPDITSLSQSDQTLRMVSDAQSALQAGVRTRQYKRLILAGKSIGTLIMAFLLSQDCQLDITATIWLTPLLQIPFVSAAIQKTIAPAFIAGGTADSTFDPASVALLEKMPNITLLRVQGGDHSLEIPNDLNRSLIALCDLVEMILNLAH
jgi:predicted alpha/beta-hydrolase family hydrolase